MSFIIINGNLIAKTEEKIKSGTMVSFSYQRTKEKINASRQWNLLNSRMGKISNAKKLDKKYLESEGVFNAQQINYLEFLLL